MLPLNYAILKYFTTVERACADDVIAALAPEYISKRCANRRSLKR